MKNETLILFFTAVIISPIMSYAIMWRALNDNSGYFSFQDLKRESDCTLYIYIAVTLSATVLLSRPTVRPTTDQLPGISGNERSADSNSYRMTCKPTSGGLVSIALCVVYLAAWLLISNAYYCQHIGMLCMPIIMVLSFPLGWTTGASVVHNNVTVLHWTIFQCLSVGNCFLLGYGLVGFVRFLRR